MGEIAELTDVAHAIRHPGGGEIGVEHLVVTRGLGLEATDLLRAAIVAGMWIDCHDGDALGCGPGEHDRAATAEAPDLDDLVPRVCRCSDAVQPGGLVVRQPSIDTIDSGQQIVQGAPCHAR